MIDDALLAQLIPVRRAHHAHLMKYLYSSIRLLVYTEYSMGALHIYMFNALSF